jgi:hypothetical protein
VPAVPPRPPVRRELLARVVLLERIRRAWASASWSERTASVAAPGVALLGVVLAWALHWQGVDMAAQLYRVNLFRQYGWLLWDSRWYGGHYVLPYSVLFPPLGAALGLYGAAALSAAAAAWGFDQLVRRTWGARATLCSVLFAAGIVVPVAIGQLPFLSGEAAGLLAVLAATRGRTWIAALLSVCCGLLSPVAGVFLVLVLFAWAIARPRGERRALLVLTAVAAGPVVALGVPFPEPGSFPFWGVDLVFILALCGLGVLLLPNRLRALRIGLALYAAAAIALFLVPNPLGGNFGRLGEALAPAAILVWSFSSGRRAVAILVALPVLFWHGARRGRRSNPVEPIRRTPRPTSRRSCTSWVANPRSGDSRSRRRGTIGRRRSSLRRCPWREGGSVRSTLPTIRSSTVGAR